MYDVVVLGAGPAGSTAAAVLARRGLSVALIDRADPRVGPSASVLLGGGVVRVLAAAGVNADRVVTARVKTVRFVSDNFQKQATVRVPARTAGFADVSDLRRSLISAAENAGAALLFGHQATDLKADEHAVRVRIDAGAEAVGGLAVVALGWEGAADLLPAGSRPGGQVSHRLHVEIPGGAAGSPADPEAVSVNLILGTKTGEVGYWWQRGEKLVLEVGSGASEEDAAKAAAVRLAKRLVELGQARRGVLTAVRGAQATVCPAGKALEADSHVIKRGLIVGKAGGFVTAASYAEVLPAMRSAQLAAEVLCEALSSEQTQDALSRFESKWRTTLAADLQPLDTDMRFLQPLVFSNEAIARRTALSILGARGN